VIPWSQRRGRYDQSVSRQAGSDHQQLQTIVREVFELFEQNLTSGLAHSRPQAAQQGRAKSSKVQGSLTEPKKITVAATPKC
jgi:hypothetical protein